MKGIRLEGTDKKWLTVPNDNPIDIARLKNILNKKGGAGLEAFPSKTIGMFIRDHTFF